MKNTFVPLITPGQRQHFKMALWRYGALAIGVLTCSALKATFSELPGGILFNICIN